MLRHFYLLSCLISITASAQSSSSDSNFFANESVQRRQPEAFVLQPESENFLHSMDSDSIGLREGLVLAIKEDPRLYEAILAWETLTIEEQVPFLRQVFALEVQLMNIKSPELIIDSGRIPGRAAFFEFNVEKPDAGKVFLNPEVLKGMDKYASLALLIHETRHSAQFQLAFGAATGSSTAAQAYRAAFVAQNTDIRSFCDFLTLANEFEAFQFGNYVLGKLTSWKVDMPGMGTFASQFSSAGELKVDLLQLLKNKDPKNLLEKFNEAELGQCKLLGFCK